MLCDVFTYTIMINFKNAHLLHGRLMARHVHLVKLATATLDGRLRSIKLCQTMSLLQRQPSLPTPQQTGIDERGAEEANTAVQKEIFDLVGASRKRKHYTNFSDK